MKDKSIGSAILYLLVLMFGALVILVPMAAILGECAGVLMNTFHLITGR